MNNLTSDHIVIDTNIFLHLLNDQENENAHIDKLLSSLMADKVRLFVDTRSKISGEYLARVAPAIVRAVDSGIKIQLLRYYLNMANWDKKEVDALSPLWAAIKRVIIEDDEIVDRVFVAMSCVAGRHLITNDGEHILNRRSTLHRCTRRWRNGSYIYSSKEACARL